MRREVVVGGVHTAGVGERIVRSGTGSGIGAPNSGELRANEDSCEGES